MGDIRKVANTKAGKKIFYYGEPLHRFKTYGDIDLLGNIYDLIIIIASLPISRIYIE